MDKKYFVIENILPQILQDYVENLCVSKDFGWGFQEDATDSNNMSEKKVPAFSHMVMYQQNIVSNFAVNLQPVFMVMCESAGLDFNTLDRVRFGMYLPLNLPYEYNNIHTDTPIEHTVLLYYVNDTDGPTHLFDDNDNLVDKIYPKKGSALVFDGRIRHASSLPTQEKRIICNLNFQGLQV